MRRELSPADVRSYVERDWEAVRESKRAYWRERSKRAGLSELLAVAEQMRIPSTEQAREADLKTHARVAAILAKTDRAHLIVTKVLAGRPQDLVDVQELLAIHRTTVPAASIRALLVTIEQALDEHDLVPRFEALLTASRAGPSSSPRTPRRSKSPRP